jgi:hypothetical protein
VNDTEWQNILNSEWTRGNVSNFEYVATKWETIHYNSSVLSSEFTKFNTSVVQGVFVGKAATTFSTLVSDCNEIIRDLPTVSNDIASVLRNHANQLAGYQREARAALARAKTNWKTRNDASSQRKASERKQQLIRGQIQEVRLAGDPAQQAHVVTLLSEERRITADVAYHKANQTKASARVAVDRSTHAALKDHETKLNRDTARALEKVNLRSLKDPNLWERITGGVGNFFTELGENMQQMIAAALARDWNRALWELRKVLDSLLIIVAAIAIVIAIAAAVVLSGGAAAGFLAVAANVCIYATLFLAVVKLKTTSILFDTQGVDPETGKRIGKMDLFLDTLTVVTAAFGVTELKTAGTIGRGTGAGVSGFGKAGFEPSKLVKGWSTNPNAPKNIFRIGAKEVVGIDFYRAGPKATGALTNFHFKGPPKTWLKKIWDVQGAIGDTNDGLKETADWISPPPVHEESTKSQREYILKQIQWSRNPPTRIDSPVIPYFIAPSIRRQKAAA